MNKFIAKTIYSALSSYIDVERHRNDDLVLNYATTSLQNAKEGAIVFYRFRDEKEETIDKFKKRINNCKNILLVTNYYQEELVDQNIPIVVVNDSCFLHVQKVVADILYPIDLKKIKLAGVTGTNGKTTVVNLAVQMAEQAGISALSIGTVGIGSKDKILQADIGGTTPSYIDLRHYLYTYRDKADIFFIEVSSHALEQDRLYDLKLSVAAWTSFSQDHLDYHKNMEDYFLSKMIILKKLGPDGVLFVPCRQHDLFLQIQEKLGDNKSVVKLTTAFSNSFTDPIPSFFKIQHNQDNTETSFSICSFLLKKDNFQIDLEKIKPPAGRFQIVEYEKKMIVVDYAHTPDALEKILMALRQTFLNRKITVVFGCGGDRDKGKRSIMGQVAINNADEVIITSDNPRGEDPWQIMLDIEGKNINNPKIEKFISRKEAIEYAIRKMTVNEIVLIAGKGHEKYQEVAGEKIYFSDYDLAQEFLKTNRSNNV